MKLEKMWIKLAEEKSFKCDNVKIYDSSKSNLNFVKDKCFNWKLDVFASFQFNVERDTQPQTVYNPPYIFCL